MKDEEIIRGLAVRAGVYPGENPAVVRVLARLETAEARVVGLTMERDAALETITGMHQISEQLLADRNAFLLALQGAGVHAESERCWCIPEVKTVPNGNRVIVHNRPI